MIVSTTYPHPDLLACSSGFVDQLQMPTELVDLWHNDLASELGLLQQENDWSEEEHFTMKDQMREKKTENEETQDKKISTKLYQKRLEATGCSLDVERVIGSTRDEVSVRSSFSYNAIML